MLRRKTTKAKRESDARSLEGTDKLEKIYQEWQRMEKDNVANIPETEQKEFKAQFVQDWNKVLAKYEHITGRQAIEIALEFFIQKYQELQARTKNWHSRKPG